MVSVNEYKKVRLEFIKTGKAKFISHLDLNRTLKSVFTRSKVAIWYTNGFNPHPKLVFSLPLSLGAESLCEFLDIRVLPPVDCEDIKNRLNANLPADIQIKRVYFPNSKLEDMQWAIYEFKLVCNNASEELAQKIQNCLCSPIIIQKRTKKTKSGFMQADISEGIKNPYARYDQGAIYLSVTLCASTDGYVNPDYIIRALSIYENLNFEESGEYYTVMKKTPLLANGKTIFE